MKPITRKQWFEKLDVVFEELEKINSQFVNNYDFRDCLAWKFIDDTISKSTYSFTCGLQLRENKYQLPSFKDSLYFKPFVESLLVKLNVPSEFWNVSAHSDGVFIQLLCSDDCVVDK